jgi:hypothetical protein
VELIHETDEAGKRAIEARGFGLSHLPDLCGRSSFSSDRAGTMSSRGKGWLVIVTMPDDEAEPYRYRHVDGELDRTHLSIPWEVVNRHEPFRFERVSVS